MENLVKSLKKVGVTQQGVDAEIRIRGVLFLDPDEIKSSWRSAQKDSDIFPGVGATPGMFEVIPHG